MGEQANEPSSSSQERSTSAYIALVRALLKAHFVHHIQRLGKEKHTGQQRS
jgi:hypothetical protein